MQGTNVWTFFQVLGKKRVYPFHKYHQKNNANYSLFKRFELFLLQVILYHMTGKVSVNDEEVHDLPMTLNIDDTLQIGNRTLCIQSGEITENNNAVLGRHFTLTMPITKYYSVYIQGSHYENLFAFLPNLNPVKASENSHVGFQMGPLHSTLSDVESQVQGHANLDGL